MHSGLVARSLALALLVVTASFLVAPPAAAQGAEVWSVEAVVQGPEGVRTEQFWMKGRRMRHDLVIAGRPIVQICNGDTFYAIDALRGEGIAIQRGAKAVAADAKGGRPALNVAADMLRRGAEKVKGERFAGRSVTMYRLTAETARQSAWVTEDEKNLLVKLELLPRGASSPTISYFNWDADLEIPDAFFEPDPRVRLDRMSASEYLDRATKGPVGPIPVLHDELVFDPREASAR